MLKEIDEGGYFHPSKDEFCDTVFDDNIKKSEFVPRDLSGISTRLWMATKFLTAILSNHKLLEKHTEEIIKSMDDADITYQPRFLDNFLSTIALKQADSLIKMSKEKI